jgi:hypothetical protein
MANNENKFHAWLKAQPKRSERAKTDHSPTTPPEVVEGLSTQNGNGQHHSPDQKTIPIGDGMPSPEFQAEARARLEASCITHSSPRSEFRRPKLADGVTMTEEQFTLLSFSPGPEKSRYAAKSNEQDEYLAMLEKMGANVNRAIASSSPKKKRLTIKAALDDDFGPSGVRQG